MSYQQPLRILLIEDTPADARLIQTILRPPSFEVTVVERLSSALALLHTMHIDVILLDLTLPDSRGPDALEAIREGSPGTAIVVIAGNDDLETALDAVARGAHHYVIKERSSEETIVSSVRQAFERSRAEKQLRACQALVENSSDGISLVDGEGYVLYASPAITRILGYPVDEFVGRNVFSLIHPDDVTEARERFAAVLANYVRPAPMIDVRYRHRDGTWRYLEVLRVNRLDDPAVRAIVVNFRDVTERRQALEDTDQLRRQYELILNSIAEGVHGLDSAGNITFENPAAAAMLGWVAADLIGKPAHETIHHSRHDGAPHDKGMCPILATLADGLVRHESDDVFWRKDGTSIRVDYVAAPKCDGEGRTTGVVVAFRDITRQQEMQGQVEQAMRVSSLGRVAASVAHEFNNVLMGIQPFAEILQRKVGHDEVLQKPLRHILDGMKRGRFISHQILRFASPAEPRLATTDLGEWTRGFSEEARQALPDRHLDVGPAESLVVRADSSQLAQVMLNLVTNARDACPDGATIAIGDVRADSVPFLRRRLTDPAQFAAVFVRDSGQGIAPEVLEHIFEPLFTTKRNGGTGLGLTVAHQIMSEHGGKILVESEVGAGSTFYVTLPLEQPSTLWRPEPGGERVDGRSSS